MFDGMDQADLEWWGDWLRQRPPLCAGDEPSARDPELLAKALAGTDGATIVSQSVTLSEGFGPVARVDYWYEDPLIVLRHVAFRRPDGTVEAQMLIAEEAADYDALRAPAAKDWRRFM